MQHVADDVLCVLLRFLPGHLDGAGRQRLGPHHCGGPGEPVGPQHGEAGAGLRGAGAVLGDALVVAAAVVLRWSLLPISESKFYKQRKRGAFTNKNVFALNVCNGSKMHQIDQFLIMCF